MKRYTQAVMISAIASLSMLSVAYGAGEKNQGYLVDRNGNIVSSARTGHCLRTRDWTPERSNPQCKAASGTQVKIRSSK
jgi:hypothetical protein